MPPRRRSETTQPVSRDNPRLLQRVRDGAYARATDPAEYVSMTSAMGYRDVTDEGGSTTKSSSGSSNTGTGSGGTPTTDNTTSTSTK